MTSRKTCRRSDSAGRVLAALVLPVMMVASFCIGCGSAADKAMTEGSSGRTAAAEFSLTDIQGKVHHLSDYRGKVVVLNFWDTWCGPCRQEIPGFIALQDQLGSEGLQLLGVALGQEGAARVKDFTAGAGINYPVLLLGENSTVLADYGGINSIPATFIIDREGYIADKHIGYLAKSAFEAMVRPVIGTGGETS